MSEASSGKICFLICPIKEPDSDARKRSDMVCKYLIEPIVQPFGYDVVRADRISEPGTITHQIIEQIINAELLVADLTDGNPNVFYELAVRHAIKKPFVHLIHSDQAQKIPFDVAGTRTIQYSEDVPLFEKAKEELESQIRSIEAGDFEFHSPISMTIDLTNLRESGSELNKNIGTIIEGIIEIRSQISDIKGELHLRREQIKGIYSDQELKKHAILNEIMEIEHNIERLEKSKLDNKLSEIQIRNIDAEIESLKKKKSALLWRWSISINMSNYFSQ